MSFECNAFGKKDVVTDTALSGFKIKRRAVGDNDVHLEILSSSICHSDIHHINREWNPALTGTQVVGHEMCGRAVAIGKNVKNVEIGKIYGVGCMVGTNCVDPVTGNFTCSRCVERKDEVYCEKGNIGTYGSPEVVDGVEQSTFGGYSTDIVVDAKFAVEIPEFYHDKLTVASPILCAGITVYTPLKRAGVTKGSKVGVVGVGGLGMFAIKIAQALGAEVYAVTRSTSKVQPLLDEGCKGVILSTDAENFKQYTGKLDCIIDTVSAKHDIAQLLGLLTPYGALGIVGASPEALDLPAFSLILGSKQIYGSLIGNIKDTQAVLNLCAEHKICVPVEVIKPEYINEAYKRVVNSDVKYRFSIDIQALREAKLE